MVVNNAGTIRRNRRLHELDLETWNEQLATNLTGHFLVLHAALPHLLAAEGDRAIVNVGSTLAHKMVPGHSAYAAAKGGMVSLTRSLAVEYGPDGIRANAVMPAVVRTPLAHTDRPDFEQRQARHGARLSAAPSRRGGGRRLRDRVPRQPGCGLDQRDDRRRRRRLQRYLSNAKRLRLSVRQAAAAAAGHTW